MLIIKSIPEENGAHQNNYSEQCFNVIPDGWVVVPETLIAKTLAMLPWIIVEFDENDAITDIKQGVIPPVIPIPEPEPIPGALSQGHIDFVQGLYDGAGGGL